MKNIYRRTNVKNVNKTVVYVRDVTFANRILHAIVLPNFFTLDLL